MRDERIDQDRRHIAAIGFVIWYILLLGILMYRQFYLAQPWGKYWDIALAFFVGTLYVTIAAFARGAVIETSAVRAAKWTVPLILAAIVAVLYLQGRITTVVDLLAVVTSALVSLSVLGLLFLLAVPAVGEKERSGQVESSVYPSLFQPAPDSHRP